MLAATVQDLSLELLVPLLSCASDFEAAAESCHKARTFAGGPKQFAHLWFGFFPG